VIKVAKLHGLGHLNPDDAEARRLISILPQEEPDMTQAADFKAIAENLLRLNQRMDGLVDSQNDDRHSADAAVQSLVARIDELEKSKASTRRRANAVRTAKGEKRWSEYTLDAVGLTLAEHIAEMDAFEAALDARMGEGEPCVGSVAMSVEVALTAKRASSLLKSLRRDKEAKDIATAESNAQAFEEA
jgi:hypothetical protein